MAENNSQKGGFQDFGMDNEKNTENIKPVEQKTEPTIIHYDKSEPPKTADIKPQADVKPQVDPKDTAGPSITKPTQIPTMQATPKPVTPIMKTPSSNPEARKKAIIGCLGAFGGILILFLILSFVFIGQTDQESNPIAKLLGLNTSSFVNGLITLVHIIFIIIALTTFIFTMIGLFKTSMAKKEDIEGRKTNLKMTIIAGSTLLIVLILWIIAYAYLDGKRIKIAEKTTQGITTTPEETLNLSAPVEIKFDASNIPLNRKKFQIVSTNWDFGDKETATGQIVSHTFKDKGIFDVKLEVTVKDKETGEISVGGEYHVTVSITDQALTAIIKADPQSGEAPLEVKLDASDSVDPDGKIGKYEWDLDYDGQFDDSEDVQLTHTFEKIGKYKIALRVTSNVDENNYNIAEKEIDVIESQAPTAVITVVNEPKEYLLGVNYVFKADQSTSKIGKIEKYEWDFSDGKRPQATKSVSYSFDKEGSYEVVLKVTDEEGKTGETTKIITIGSPKGTPKAIIKTTPQKDSKNIVTGKVPLKVVFDASDSTDSDRNIVDYNWDFTNDGVDDAFGETASYTFTKEGTYTTTLSIEDADNNVGKASVVIEAQSQGIRAVLNADKEEGSVPLTVTLDASGSTYKDGKITSYRWDFGDNTPVKLGSAQITHKYTGIGNYTAKVTAIGSDNSTDTAQVNISVREISLQACFVSVFERGPAPLETTFDPGCSTGTITKYFWDFGDGSTSTQVKPNHIFEKPGTYEVILETSDAENTVSKAKITINVT